MSHIIRLIIIITSLSMVSCGSTITRQNKMAAIYNTRLGLAYLQHGNIERAKIKLLLAIKQDQHNPLVLTSFGYFLEKSGNVNLASKYYHQAITIAPYDGSILNNYGAFLCRQKEYKQAIHYFLLAVKDMNYLHVAEAYKNAGLCALRIPDKKLANKFFKKARQNSNSFSKNFLN